mgnify:CR=1 FL=1
MSRTCAQALVLINWKGVFYERYLIDRHVTALEGANGAGKTTVMIAAYVVLLPDMSRLRFTNLGETGATGGDKGIWGRLGEPAALPIPPSTSPSHPIIGSLRAYTWRGRASHRSSRRRSSSPVSTRMFACKTCSCYRKVTTRLFRN